MNLSTEEAMRETVRLALEQSLAQHLKTDVELERYFDIRKEAATRIDAEKDAFKQDYTLRLAKAREIILREQSGHILNPPKPSWAVNKTISADKVDLLAHNRVQRDHEQRIATIRVDQVDQYKVLRTELSERVSREEYARDLRQGHAKDAMTTANQLSPFETQGRTRSGPTRS